MPKIKIKKDVLIFIVVGLIFLLFIVVLVGKKKGWWEQHHTPPSQEQAFELRNESFDLSPLQEEIMELLQQFQRGDASLLQQLGRKIQAYFDQGGGPQLFSGLEAKHQGSFVRIANVLAKENPPLATKIMRLLQTEGRSDGMESILRAFQQEVPLLTKNRTHYESALDVEWEALYSRLIGGAKNPVKPFELGFRSMDDPMTPKAKIRAKTRFIIWGLTLAGHLPMPSQK